MKEKRFQKIYIEITNVCNLECAFCPDTKRIKGFMTAENFEEAVKKVCKYTNLIYLHVKGEPLLHPKLKEILDICEKYGIMVNLTTNGTLILHKVNILKKYKALRQINLSIHSIKQNDGIYDTENYLKDVFSAVRILNDETDILISFRLWNLKEMQANPENKEIINMIEKEYKIENLLSKSLENKSIRLGTRIYLNQDREFTWPDMKREVISETGKCLGLKNQIAILVNGDVVPCCLDHEGDMKFGNIFYEDLDEIINKERCRLIISGFQKHKLVEALCKRCGFRSRFGDN